LYSRGWSSTSNWEQGLQVDMREAAGERPGQEETVSGGITGLADQGRSKDGSTEVWNPEAESQETQRTSGLEADRWDLYRGNKTFVEGSHFTL